MILFQRGTLFMKDREAAVYTLMDIFEQEGYNNIVLRRTFKKNDEFTSVQKAFITEIVNGTKVIRATSFVISMLLKKHKQVKTIVRPRILFTLQHNFSPKSWNTPRLLKPPATSINENNSTSTR